MSYTTEVIDTVNDLIENCKDGEYGFKECAEHADSPTLKTMFERRATECQAAATELQRIVYANQEQPSTGGTASGAMHRGWLNIKAALSLADDKAVLEECERGEDRALARYDKALKKELPDEIRSVLVAQRAGVQRNHDLVRSLRDQARAAAHH